MHCFCHIFKGNFQYLIPLNKKNPITPQTTGAVTTHSARAQAAKFWQWNIFIVLALACNGINFIYYLVDGMIKSAVIEVSGIAILFYFLYCNLKGLFETPKLLSIIFVNLHACCLCYVEGTSQGAYLYLFPFVMAMIFFLRVRKNNLVLTAFISGTTLNLLAIVLLLPYHGRFEPVTDGIGYRHFALNIIINFLLVVIFFYFVLRLLDAKEKKKIRSWRRPKPGS